MKRKRLFVNGTLATDDCSWFCGGPNPTEARRGLMNLLEHHIGELLGPDYSDRSEITLIVEEMTDEEVENLPDI